MYVYEKTHGYKQHYKNKILKNHCKVVFIVHYATFSFIPHIHTFSCVTLVQYIYNKELYVFYYTCI